MKPEYEMTTKGIVEHMRPIMLQYGCDMEKITEFSITLVRLPCGEFEVSAFIYHERGKDS